MMTPTTLTNPRARVTHICHGTQKTAPQARLRVASRSLFNPTLFCHERSSTTPRAATTTTTTTPIISSPTATPTHHHRSHYHHDSHTTPSHPNATRRLAMSTHSNPLAPPTVRFEIQGRLLLTATTQTLHFFFTPLDKT